MSTDYERGQPPGHMLNIPRDLATWASNLTRHVIVGVLILWTVASR